MKYSEFERDIEAMGYSLDSDKDSLFVKKGERFFISVSFRSTYTIDSSYIPFRNLEDLEKERLLGLVWQLASTPIDEREDEKKYRLRIPFMNDRGYLNFEKEIGSYCVTTKLERGPFKTIFTEPEVEELKQNYNLDSFVMEEVKEDE